MLKNPRTLIDDAAEQSGFTDRIHFTKVFRRLTGQTPGQFQRQFRVVDEAAGAVSDRGIPNAPDPLRERDEHA